MSALEKARWSFREVGLAFPNSPAELAARLKERGRWWFSTRDDEISPYILDEYVKEAKQHNIQNYVVLAHSGHGANSCAIQYYLVYGGLRMFLFLGWGGVYMDPKGTAVQIKSCFSLADDIARSFVNASKSQADCVTIVASDFYGSYWRRPGIKRQRKGTLMKRPAEVLAEVLCWLNGETRPMQSASTPQTGKRR